MKKLNKNLSEKRLRTLGNRRLFLSKQLTKQLIGIFQHTAEFGYCHHDVYLFCKKWLKMYDAYRKIGDKLESVLPF